MPLQMPGMMPQYAVGQPAFSQPMLPPPVGFTAGPPPGFAPGAPPPGFAPGAPPMGFTPGAPPGFALPQGFQSQPPPGYPTAPVREFPDAFCFNAHIFLNYRLPLFGNTIASQRNQNGHTLLWNCNQVGIRTLLLPIISSKLAVSSCQLLIRFLIHRLIISFKMTDSSYATRLRLGSIL